jgi:hypothetical protein
MQIVPIFLATALSLATAVIAVSLVSEAPATSRSAGDDQVGVTTVIVREIEAAQRKAEAEMFLQIEALTTHKIGTAEAARTLRW